MKIKNRYTRKVHFGHKLTDGLIADCAVTLDTSYEVVPDDAPITCRKCRKRMCPICKGEGRIDRGDDSFQPGISGCVACKGTGRIP